MTRREREITTSPNTVHSQTEAPAREAIKYDKVQFAAMPNDMNDFRGDPRPEYEAAWNRLLSGTYCFTYLTVGVGR